MNIVDGRVSLDGGPRFVAGGDASFSIPLTADQAARLGSSDQTQLVAGIRPEDLRVGPSNAATTQALTGIVDASEPLGNEVLVYLRVGEHDLTARADSRTLPRPGDRLALSVDPERVHYFDRGTGGALLDTPHGSI
jgi:multiple sugar transport system ATP-binding protein